MSNGKRFGGAHSPGGGGADARATQQPAPENRFRGRKASNVNLKALILFFAPTPLIFAAFAELGAGRAIGMVLTLAAYAALILSAWITRDGVKAAEEYERRATARPPAFPRKFVGAVLSGAGVGMACLFGWGVGLIESVLFAAMAFAAHVAAFGLDPRKAKGLEGVSAAEAERIADTIARAEDMLTEMEDAGRSLRDRTLTDRVSALAAAVRSVIQTVEEDPRDLRRARKFLTVYLQGARDSTLKYADASRKSDDPEMTEKFSGLLSDLEKSFAKHRETLLLDDMTDLDVEIEVLRDRLRQEGVAGV